MRGVVLLAIGPLKGHFRIDQGRINVYDTTIAEIILSSDIDEAIVVHEISGFRSHGFSVKFVKGASKVLVNKECWKYFIEIEGLKEGKYTIEPVIHYSVGDKRDRLFLNKEEIEILGSGKEVKSPDFELTVIVSKPKCEPSEIISIGYKIKNQGLENVRVLRIENAVPFNFRIHEVDPDGVPINNAVQFGDLVLERGGIKELKIEARAPSVTELRYFPTIFETIPQLIVIMNSGDQRVLSFRKYRIDIDLAPKIVSAFIENDDGVIKVPGSFLRYLGVDKVGNVNMVRSGREIIIMSADAVIQDPLEKLRSKVFKLISQRDELYYRQLIGEIDEGEYKKRIKVIEDGIREIEERISSMEEILVPKLALRFGGGGKDLEEEYRLYRMVLDQDRKEILLKMIEGLIEEESRLKGAIMMVPEAIKDGSIPKDRIERIEEDIKKRLHEISQFKKKILRMIS